MGRWLESFRAAHRATTGADGVAEDLMAPNGTIGRGAGESRSTPNSNQRTHDNLELYDDPSFAISPPLPLAPLAPLGRVGGSGPGKSAPNGANGANGTGVGDPQTETDRNPGLHIPEPPRDGFVGEPYSRATPEEAEQDRLDRYEERAAIVQEGSGCPAEWAEGFATLDTSHPPAGVTLDRWRQVLDDAGKFLDAWGIKAHALGWDVPSIFGCCPRKPDQRLDCMGLAWLISGREIVAITATSAAIKCKSGNILTYRRRPDEAAQGRVPIWELPP